MNLLFSNISSNIISKLTSTILSSHSVLNYIMTRKENEIELLQNELLSSDINNKLSIILSLIKNILRVNNVDNIEELIANYKKPLLEIIDVDNDFSVVSVVSTKNTNNKNINNDNKLLPEPIKICVNSTLEIIEKINILLNNIHVKISKYDNSYVKFMYKINVHKELVEIKLLNIIFDKRLKLLIDICNLYDIL